MIYTFHESEEEDDGRRILIWQSEVLNRQGTYEHVFCDEAWFWASANGRWMIENEAQGLDRDYPGFRTLRFTPVDGNRNDCYVT